MLACCPTSLSALHSSGRPNAVRNTAAPVVLLIPRALSYVTNAECNCVYIFCVYCISRSFDIVQPINCTKNARKCFNKRRGRSLAPYRAGLPALTSTLIMFLFAFGHVVLSRQAGYDVACCCERALFPFSDKSIQREEKICRSTPILSFGGRGCGPS